MTVKFNQVIPNPMQNHMFSDESVWGKALLWHAPQNFLLKAVSGKGKSSFVDFISGVRTDFMGDIFIDEQSIKTLSIDDWSKLRTDKLSVVYQDLQLFEDLTVKENILIKNQLTHHFSEEKIDYLIEKVGLILQKNQNCKTLSLGQKQRVAILRALTQPFKLLVLDEPFSHLDKNNEIILIEIIEQELKANQAGLILTTLGDIPHINFDKHIEL